MSSNERVKKLRDEMLTTPEICVERGYLMTESYRETEGQPYAIRRARALEKILNEMTIRIEDGELIVGWATSKPRGGAILPEIQCKWILDEMDELSTRQWDKYAPLSEDEKQKLRDFIPYWKGKTLNEQWIATVPEEAQRFNHVIQTSGGFSENGHHFAHAAADFEKVLSIGLVGVRKEAAQKLAELDLKVFGELEKYHFYKSVIITLDAVMNFADRYADLAKEMAAAETDSKRKPELEKIAQTCRKVPAEPAETLYEAMQSIWFLYVALMIEGWGAGMSLGRCDQYLYPFYKRDIEAGIINDEETQELFELLLVKLNGVVALANSIVATFMGGYPVMQGLTVGGVKKDGRSAVNELSYIMLDAEKEIGLTSEDLVVRINKNTPDGFLIKACEVAKQLKGKLKFVSDETTIQALLTNGIPIDSARDYISTGCHNPTVPAVSHDIGGVSFNLAMMMDLALNNGASRLTGEQIGPETGDPRNFKSYEEVYEAYRKQVEALLPIGLLYKNVDLELFSQTPCPLQSALYTGCMEKGVDINCGGTYPYITHTTGLAGSPNVGDSLAAIKKVVFEDRRITMDRLIDALDRNFEGEDEVLHLLKKAPKYGNDDDYADLILRDVLVHSCDILRKHTTYAGIKSTAAAITMTGNIPLGWAVGALPDGRKAGAPLAEGGISPHQGRNVNGPTATLSSVAKLDQVKLSNGSILNMRLSPGAIKDRDKMVKFISMVRTFCETGGDLVQFNFIDNEMLRDAQKNPKKYKDLLVRVATYSAYFVELSPELQNDIIERVQFEEL